MKCLPLLAITLSLSACGVETTSAVATGAALKKQEIEQGRKKMEQMQQKIDQANLLAQQRADQADGER